MRKSQKRIAHRDGSGDANHGEGGHEHPDPVLPNPIARAAVFFDAQTALNQALEDSTHLAAYERQLESLSEEGERLDWLVQVARQAMLGDRKAVDVFLRALPVDDGPGEESPHGSRPVSRAHDEPRLDANGHDSDSPERLHADLPQAVIDAYLDIASAAAVVAGDDDARYSGLVGALERRFSTVVPTITALAETTDRYLRQNGTRELFLSELDLLLDPPMPRPMPTLPKINLLAECAIEMRHALLARPVPVEVHPNTDRIVAVTPDDVCVGSEVTIHADPADPFDWAAFPDDRRVYFACEAVAEVISYTPTAVTVRVPPGARTGLVYFGSVGSGEDWDPFAAARAACGILFPGASLSKATMLESTESCWAMRVPAGASNAIVVRHPPAVTLWAAYRDGQWTTEAEACSEVEARWHVFTWDEAAPTVEILKGSEVIVTDLPATGSYPIVADPGATYVVKASNSCGSDTSWMLDLDLFYALHLSSPAILETFDDEPAICVAEGASEQVTVRTSCRVAQDTTVTFAPHHDADAVAVQATAVIPAGLESVTVEVTGVHARPSAGPAATITVDVDGYPTAFLRVWVTNPRGSWELLSQEQTGLEMVPVHAAVLASREVLFFSGDPYDYNNVDKGAAALFDPETSHAQRVEFARPRNLFCGGQSFLADGRLVVAGGHAFTGLGVGADHDVHVFNPWTKTWTYEAYMGKARWYPTCTTLPSGQVLIVAGSCVGAPQGGNPFSWFGWSNENYDCYDAAAGLLSEPHQRFFMNDLPLYPFVKLLPGGALFVHRKERSNLLFQDRDIPAPLERRPSPHTYFSVVSRNHRTYPGQGACVLLPLLWNDPDRASVMVVGGADESGTDVDEHTQATNTVEIFDFDARRGPAERQVGWRTVTSMSNRRFMSDAVLLPDRKVLVVGGCARGKADTNDEPVFEPELFDTRYEVWRRMAPHAVERRYHSIAVLLPDGRVLCGGSTKGWPPGVEFRLEIFSPPYLFRGPRPEIAHVSSRIRYGEQFQVQMANGMSVASAALIRPSAVTHTNDMDQRHVELQMVDQVAESVILRAPRDATIAPPGYYMLFILTAREVPSVAAFVRIG